MRATTEDTMTERQLLSRLIKKDQTADKVVKRWNLLYDMFEKRYYIDLKNRPQGASKLDYIDVVIDKMMELYELAIEIFEVK